MNDLGKDINKNTDILLASDANGHLCIQANTPFENVLYYMPGDIIDILERSKNIKERSDYHPESSVYEHIRIVYERARTTNDINFIMAAIFHDIGKAYCYEKHGKSYGHDKISNIIFVKYASHLEYLFGIDINKVSYMISEHMRVKLIDKMRPNKANEIRSSEYFDYVNRFSAMDDMLTNKETW